MKFNRICPKCGSEELYKGLIEETEEAWVRHYTCLECDTDIYLKYKLAEIEFEGVQYVLLRDLF